MRPSAHRALGLRQQFQQHRQRGLHAGDDAGADRCYRRRGRIVGDLEDRGRAIEDRGMAFDMKRKHRRADHDHQIMVAQRVRELRRRGMQEACELRMPFRETAARRKRTGPDRGLGLLRNAIPSDSTACARSTPGPTTRAGRLLAESAVTSAFIASGSGPISRLMLRASNGCDLMGPVVDRHRHESRPAGRLHRHVIGACDRGRNILSPRRLDARI